MEAYMIPAARRNEMTSSCMYIVSVPISQKRHIMDHMGLEPIGCVATH